MIPALQVATIALVLWFGYQLHKTRKELSMAATRADLDAAIDTLTSTLNTALTDLLAKIQAGTVATPEDFSAEVTKLQAITAAAQGDDPGAPASS